jgi:hypothetical protein
MDAGCMHYRCLDIEGAEPTILRAYDFAHDRRILALSVEGDRCDDLLAAQGYSHVKNPFAPSGRSLLRPRHVARPIAGLGDPLACCAS